MQKKLQFMSWFDKINRKLEEVFRQEFCCCRCIINRLIWSFWLPYDLWLPYDFLVANLLPFDISSKAVNFICSDLKPRRQKVRVFLVLFKPFFRECHKRPILFARLWDLPNFNLLLIPINYYIKYLIKSFNTFTYKLFNTFQYREQYYLIYFSMIY